MVYPLIDTAGSATDRLVGLARRRLLADTALLSVSIGLLGAATVTAAACLAGWLGQPVARSTVLSGAGLVFATGLIATVVKRRGSTRAAPAVADHWTGEPDLLRTALSAGRGGLADLVREQADSAAMRVLNDRPPFHPTIPPGWPIAALAVLTLSAGLLPGDGRAGWKSGAAGSSDPDPASAQLLVAPPSEPARRALAALETAILAPDAASPVTDLPAPDESSAPTDGNAEAVSGQTVVPQAPATGAERALPSASGTGGSGPLRVTARPDTRLNVTARPRSEPVRQDLATLGRLLPEERVVMNAYLRSR